MNKIILDENEKAVFWLNCFGLSRKKIGLVLGLFKTFAFAFSKFETKENEIGKIVGESQLQLMKSCRTERFLNEKLVEIEKLNIGIVTIASESFPDSLKNIPDFPFLLFTLGDVSLLKQKSIAIVGTRKPTRYGREITEIFAKKLSESGLVVVSGLAFGIDTVAHASTLEVSGKTIAVLGGGLDEIYPAQNTELARKIVKNGGLLVSEYAPKIRPTVYSFPERNRIVSALSLGVILVEAGEKSGSLHTANSALEQGKELFIVPSNANSTASAGSNRLLEEMPHALAFRPEHVLDVLGIQYNETEKAQSRQLSFEESKILEILHEGEILFDDLVSISGFSVPTLNSLLTTLEIDGIIKRLPGNFVGI